ncbi:MAG TPA: phosphate ABC transporter ATP-binding protein [Candidatus Limnocylindrales bacterium]
MLRTNQTPPPGEIGEESAFGSPDGFGASSSLLSDVTTTMVLPPVPGGAPDDTSEIPVTGPNGLPGTPTDPYAGLDIESLPPSLRARVLKEQRRSQRGRRGARPADDAASTRRRLFGDTTPAEVVADGITAWFGEKRVLDRVSLTMRAGEVTALIGPSGCGKSTFLRILNRMHEMVPSAKLAGEVRLDGFDIYGPGQRITTARRHIGMIFQKPNPFPAMSIYDNVVAGLKLSGVRASREQKDVLVEDSLRKAALWEEVKDRLDQPGGGLSGGQQQRLCIARSLAVSPRVLLMDEPCSALDPTSTRRVEETIAALRGQVTIIIVTHNMQQAERVSDECAFFLASQNQPGVIVEHGPTDAMFNSPQDVRTRDYVGGRFG